jgi:hypothetical protein
MDRDPAQFTESSGAAIVLCIIAFVLVVYGLSVAGLAVLVVKLMGNCQ